ncbi:flagellar protein FlaG [Paenibacillus nanensis]|nr:flagellar protein FlaG [Paenibacillus nanensis]
MNITSVNTSAVFTSEKSTGSGPTKEAMTAATISAQTSHLVAHGAADEQSNKNIERFLKSLESAQTKVERSVHEETNHIMYKIKNSETGEVIREIPEEKLLDMVAKMVELNGLIIDEKI